MKALLKRGVSACLLALMLLLLPTSCAGEPPTTVHLISYTELGTPSTQRYPEGDVARSPWDMAFYDGRLYLGGGDFDTNAGPVTVFSYDPDDGVWKESPPLSEEEINRFVLLDGALAAPGIDPREGWELGNYYTLSDGEWVKNRTLPEGIHNFDLVSYEDMLFAGLGVAPGGAPVVRSTDGGEHFEGVPFFKNGTLIDTADCEIVRVYDLIVFEDALYAVFSYGGTLPSYELYRYDSEENAFFFAGNLKDTITRIKFNHLRITAKETFGDTLYLATGKLYATTDMQGFEEVIIPDTTLVCDLYKDGRDLYLLTAAKEKDGSGKFKVSVWQAWEDEEIGFALLFDFLYDVPPLSLAVDGDDFYIGMSDTAAKNPKNGTVLLVEYPT